MHQFKKNSKSLKGGHAGVELSEKKTAPLYAFRDKIAKVNRFEQNLQKIMLKYNNS